MRVRLCFGSACSCSRKYAGTNWSPFTLFFLSNEDLRECSRAKTETVDYCIKTHTTKICSNGNGSTDSGNGKGTSNSCATTTTTKTTTTTTTTATREPWCGRCCSCKHSLPTVLLNSELPKIKDCIFRFDVYFTIAFDRYLANGIV